MKIKKLLILFSVFLTLILSMGFICASQDVQFNQSSDINADNDVVLSDKDVMPLSESNSTSTNTNSQSSQSIKEKVKTKVDADQKVVKYKKRTYFKIKVENRYDDDIPIKCKLKVKIGNKEFTVKTNSYGVAKINTKSLKKGTHKVIITSLDDQYSVYKTSKIFVGKQHTATIKSTSSKKVLKNKDVIRLKYKSDFDEKEVKVAFKKKAKFTKVIKAKFYFKDKKTGRTVLKTDNCDWDDGRWEMPDEEYPMRYVLSKVKVYYISTK